MQLYFNFKKAITNEQLAMMKKKPRCGKFEFHGCVYTALTSYVHLHNTQPGTFGNHCISLIGPEGSAMDCTREPVCGNKADQSNRSRG